MLRLVLLRVLEGYFRHRWLNLLPIVLFTAAGIAYFLLFPSGYVSQGSLYVQRESLLASLTQVRDLGWSYNSPAALTANDLLEMVQTEAFVRAIIDQTDLRQELYADPSAADAIIDGYRQALAASATGENLVQFSVEAESPELAHQLATATFNTYRTWKLNNDRQESALAQEFFTQVIGPYQEQLETARDDLRAYLEANPEPVRGTRPPEEALQIAEYQAAIDTAQKRLEDALQKEESARLALAQVESDVNQTYVLIDAPTVPTKPGTSMRARVLQIAIFVIIGTMLSAVLIIGGALLDRTFLVPLDIRRALELPVLAVLEDDRKRRGSGRASNNPQQTSTAQLQPAVVE
jgi:hypothetical protein